jgi:hypothetical protein
VGKFAIAALICLAASVDVAAQASTCVGANPCMACHTCSACKRCSKMGLTCGVCAGGRNGNGKQIHSHDKDKLEIKTK